MRLLLFCALIALGFVPGSAMAKHNGNVCSAKTGSEAGLVDRSNYGVQNNSTSQYVTVSCPLNRRNLSGDPEPSGTLKVAVYNRNSGALACTLYTLSSLTGQIQFSISGNVTGSPGSGSQIITFPFIIGGETNNMLIECDVPPIQSGWLSHIASIYWG